MESLERRLLLSPITPLGSFQSPATIDTGSSPDGPVLIDPTLTTSNTLVFYGATSTGGAFGDGTIYQTTINASGATITTLASFNGTDGSDPSGALVLDTHGNLIGSTSGGGAFGQGSIFKITFAGNHASATLTTLASFTGTAGNGAAPSGLVIDSTGGNVFGIAHLGTSSAPSVELFELTSGATAITPLLTLNGDFNGNRLLIDDSNHLFGALSDGGFSNGVMLPGSVFEFTLGDNNVSTLATFSALTPGAPDMPYLDLAMDPNTDIFGTTFGNGPGQSGQSILFEIAKSSGSVLTLATFSGAGAANFMRAAAGPTIDANGNLFAPAIDGAAGDGLIYELPSGSKTLTTLAAFNGADGNGPGEVAIGPLGDLFGISSTGGAFNQGALWGLNNGAPSTQGFFAQVPTTAVDGIKLNPAVAVNILDANYLLTGGAGTVTIAPTAGTLDGSLTVPVVNGVATFNNLVFADTHSPAVALTATSTAFLTPIVSSNITVSFDTPTQLGFIQPPTMAMQNTYVTLQVAVEDITGNVVTTDNPQITLTIVAGPTNDAPGPFTAAAVNGIATFNLPFNTAGTYVLTAASSDSLASASSSILIVAPTHIPIRPSLFSGIPLSPVAKLFQEYRDAAASTGQPVPALAIIVQNALLPISSVPIFSPIFSPATFAVSNISNQTATPIGFSSLTNNLTPSNTDSNLLKTS